jgi:hypothetical protein
MQLFFWSDKVELRSAGIDDESLPKVEDLLLWFGFVGLDRTDALTKYIFTYNYDMKRFRAALNAIPEPNTVLGRPRDPVTPFQKLVMAHEEGIGWIRQSQRA